ncbi:MAG: glycogen debranching N-terminal domain-containing protein [Roseicyclus sp.]
MDDLHMARSVAAEELGSHGVATSESLVERRARTLKHDDTFAVLTVQGDMRPGSADGLYHRDTRHLSQFELRLGGARPILLSSALREDNAALVCDLSNPDLVTSGGERLAGETLHLRRVQFLWNGALHERIRIRNFGDKPLRVPLDIAFASDFADIFEVRGCRRARRGATADPETAGDGVVIRYTGLDGVDRVTAIGFAPRPDTLQPDRASYVLRLAPGEALSIHVIASTQGGAVAGSGRFLSAMRTARRALRRSASRAAAVVTSNEVFNEAVRRSAADIHMLNAETGHGPYPYAGIPWFSTVFGRDALITAFGTLWIDPDIARGVLRYLASSQATEILPASDAEPGKILHEVRQGEMARTGEVPFRRYYGSVDSTPLFVMLAAAYLDRTGDLATLRELRPAIDAALGWMRDYGDRDGDGFLEYGRRSETGLVNQGWKDSHDSVFHADGTLAQGPIALCEVQGYAYAALRGAARIATALGDAPRAADLDAEAAALRERFDKDFWCDEIGMYALALDGDKRPCRIRASNAGHALWSGIAAPQRAEAIADQFMGPGFFSGWGVRTVPLGEARYNPMSYHNGSVWPHDNAILAAGLARYGFKKQAARIFTALFDASVHMDLRRLPELFCGFGRSRAQGPTFYPVACMPQAWAVATPLSLLATCLGLSFDPPKERVVLQDPVLPDFLETVTLRNLSVGNATMDLEVRRSADGIAALVLRRSGGAKLLVTH